MANPCPEISWPRFALPRRFIGHACLACRHHVLIAVQVSHPSFNRKRPLNQISKATIMLKKIPIDLNIEKLLIGKIFRPNMVDGWSETLQWIKSHKEQNHLNEKKGLEILHPQIMTLLSQTFCQLH